MGVVTPRALPGRDLLHQSLPQEEAPRRDAQTSRMHSRRSPSTVVIGMCPGQGVFGVQPSVSCHPRQGSDGKAQSPPGLRHSPACFLASSTTLQLVASSEASTVPALSATDVFRPQASSVSQMLQLPPVSPARHPPTAVGWCVAFLLPCSLLSLLVGMLPSGHALSRW